MRGFQAKCGLVWGDEFHFKPLLIFDLEFNVVEAGAGNCLLVAQAGRGASVLAEPSGYHRVVGLPGVEEFLPLDPFNLEPGCGGNGSACGVVGAVAQFQAAEVGRG